MGGDFNFLHKGETHTSLLTGREISRCYKLAEVFNTVLPDLVEIVQPEPIWVRGDSTARLDRFFVRMPMAQLLDLEPNSFPHWT
eukprot:2583256-Lingulodinium_polyedra.AAC.1